MTRKLLTAVFALLIVLTAHADGRHKGVGCWRTIGARQQAASRMLSPQRVQIGDRTDYLGKKRGLVILAEFTDMKFKEANNREKYKNIFNQPGYTTNEGFIGSVADYFRDQSAGQFELEFDVVGPFTTQKNYKYYGQNDKNGYDLHPEEMVIEMCLAADSVVNFSDYDWDGDGEVDEVFVVYAGKSESDTGIKNYIWPHMWTFDEAGAKLTVDSLKINVYACSNEIMSNGSIEGIGTFCHEFSHCLGFPDFYDINYTGLPGMGNFDLMSSGCYVNNGFRPVGYTAYEKMMCGWQEPIVLGDEDVTVDSLRPISEHGDTYIIYNDAYPNEFYMIENRQKTNWDTNYPSRGLMITHVDFDREVWFNNIPNTIITDEEALEDGLTCGNDHQRMTLFRASSITSNALYPFLLKDSLTATSVPAATLHHANSDSTLVMQSAILDIKQHADRTVSFRYRAKEKEIEDAVRSVALPHRNNPVYYDLQGRKVKQPSRGLYIVDGKKVAVR